jgi:hypothetical protein
MSSCWFFNIHLSDILTNCSIYHFTLISVSLPRLTRTSERQVISSGIQELTVFYRLNSFPHGATVPSGTRPPHYRGFTITLRHTIFGRIPLDDRSARSGDFYLYNTQQSQESNINSHGGIRNRKPNKRAAADPRP